MMLKPCADEAVTSESGVRPGTIIAAQSVTLQLTSLRWNYAAHEATAIADAWAERTARNPALFNGRFFILDEWHLRDGAFTGTCVETDYASYLQWRGAGFPGRGWNAFAMAALHAADGRLLIGRMASWTANAGMWYPPAGSLDASDLVEDRFDLDGNIRRELGEELGLRLEESSTGDWLLAFDNGRLAMFRRFDRLETPEELEGHIRAHLAAEAAPELDDLRFVAGLADLDGLRTPDFVRRYVETAFGAA
jgi:8-oxo-dGTP pyrophosphatase MutT (NUDIX family)